MSDNTYANERRYNRSPIAEVVCQFDFKDQPSLHPFDNLVELHKTFKDILPHFEEQIIQQVRNIPDNRTFQEERRFRRLFRYFNAEKNHLVQVGDLLFSVNCFPPYPSWSNFKPMILDSFAKYLAVLPDTTLRAVKLLYINHIRIPGNSIDLADYFTFFPQMPPEIEDIGTFSMKTNIHPVSGKDGIELEISNISDSADADETVTIELRLQCIISINENSELDLALEQAHNLIGSTFELTLTEKTRNLFEVQTNG